MHRNTSDMRILSLIWPQTLRCSSRTTPFIHTGELILFSHSDAVMTSRMLNSLFSFGPPAPQRFQTLLQLGELGDG